MKQVIFLFFFFSFTTAFSQDVEIKAILSNVTRDSTNKTCKLLFDDFYESFESDAGQSNPKIVTATLNLFQYNSDHKLPNQQLAVLLFHYINAVSEPQKALQWVAALKSEYKNVYGTSHPLVLLYQGESLNNAGFAEQARNHFIAFVKEYPQSTVALVNAYGKETDDTLKKTWLTKLKKEHPNHWAVKNLK